MRLIGHIIAKDVRRVAWVWLAWLALVAAGVSWVHGRGTVGNAVLWLAGTWLVIATGFAIAGILMLGDAIEDSRAAWRTRPVGRVRLLAAKLSGGVLILGVAPWLVTLPARWGKGVWFGSFDEALLLPLVVPALAIGALARDMGHFVLCSAFLAVLHASVKTLAAVGPMLPAHLRVEREIWLQAPVWPLMAVVLIVHVLTGRTRLGWSLVAAWIVVIIARGIWPLLTGN